MAAKSADETRSQFEKLFKECDADGDNAMSYAELKTMLVLSGYKLTEAELTKQFRGIDTDDSGTISLDEFMKAMCTVPEVDHRRAIWRKAFLEWDKDKSGHVNMDELKDVYKGVLGRDITQQEADKIMLRFDKDGSGEISWEEFADFFSNM